jgi:dUTP pyrophosphatase
MEINVINLSKHSLPKFETLGSAGMDVRANLQETIVLKPLERKLIPTGLFFEIPLGFEMQVRPRSGLAYKSGITVLNAPGTIDADYRGELGILLINLSDKDFEIQDGERVAQLVIAKHEQPLLIEVKELSQTARGEGGFGSTGKK